MHMSFNFTYDPCAHQGLARLHRNQEHKSRVEPAKDKPMYDHFRKLLNGKNHQKLNLIVAIKGHPREWHSK